MRQLIERLEDESFRSVLAVLRHFALLECGKGLKGIERVKNPL